MTTKRINQILLILIMGAIFGAGWIYTQDKQEEIENSYHKEIKNEVIALKEQKDFDTLYERLELLQESSHKNHVDFIHKNIENIEYAWKKDGAIKEMQVSIYYITIDTYDWMPLNISKIHVIR